MQKKRQAGPGPTSERTGHTDVRQAGRDEGQPREPQTDLWGQMVDLLLGPRSQSTSGCFRKEQRRRTRRPSRITADTAPHHAEHGPSAERKTKSNTLWGKTGVGGKGGRMAKPGFIEKIVKKMHC